MFKSFVCAALFSVALSKKNKKRRAALDFLATVEDISQLEIEVSACDEECHEGYLLNEETCECDAAPVVPATCRLDEVFAIDTCECTHEVNETKEARCYHKYRLNADTCECEAPAECTMDDDSCSKGQYLDEWACQCVDFPVCDPCGLGFGQNPKTCECKDMTTADLRCRKKDVFDQASCSCVQTRDDGSTKQKKVKCPKGYDLNDECTACHISDFWLCKPKKCPWGQGWDSVNCQCATFPECPKDTNTKCKKGEKYNQMTCACEERQKRDKKKKDKKSKPDKDKFQKYSYDDLKEPSGEDDLDQDVLDEPSGDDGTEFAGDETTKDPAFEETTEDPAPEETSTDPAPEEATITP